MIEQARGSNETLGDDEIQEMRELLEGIANGSREIILGETEYTLKFWKGEMQKLPQVRREEFQALLEKARKALHDSLDKEIDG